MGPAFNWTTIAVGLLNLLVGGVFVQMIRSRPTLNKIANDRDASLRTDLFERITQLEKAQHDDRVQHERERKEDREACEKTTEELRQRIREQDKLIDGLQRQLIMFQVASGRVMPLSEQSPEMIKALSHLSAIYGKTGVDSQTLQKAKDTQHAADMTVEQVQQDEAKKK